MGWQRNVLSGSGTSKTRVIGCRKYLGFHVLERRASKHLFDNLSCSLGVGIVKKELESFSLEMSGDMLCASVSV